MHRLSSLLVSLALVALSSAGAQGSSATGALRTEMVAGSEAEDYARTLELLGLAPRTWWSLRPLSPSAAARVMRRPAGPWAARFTPDSDRTHWRWLRPNFGARVNSTFPDGINDGAVWAGRGLTTWASAGGVATWHAVTVRIDPLAFVAQNASYLIVPNGMTGNARFADFVNPGVVDYPQRFGDRPFAKLDPGESSMELDTHGIDVGFGTTHEWWGPAQKYPFLLGTNAAGFPHAFVGTTHPTNLWLFRFEGRTLWGRLDQSPYFVPTGVDSFLVRPRRFAAGAIVVVQPRGLDWLELGIARFVHAPWPDSGLSTRYFTRPFEGIFKKTLPKLDTHIPTDERSRDGENGLASVFARVTLPGDGFEVYTEFGREDNPWDLRYLVLSPDEQSSTTFGFAKAWLRGDSSRITRLRGERINFQEAQVDRVRGGAPIYIHSSGSNQGHTEGGQLLGAAVGVGSAAGAFLALDRVGPGGRTTFEWGRVVRRDHTGLAPNGGANPRAIDAVHSLTVERLFFRGGHDLLVGSTASYELNRNFAYDRANLGVHLSLTGLR